MKHTYQTKNTCSNRITFDLDGDVVSNIEFSGGCNGNLQAIQRILQGATVETIEQSCKGILCGRRPTSCTDQLAIAVRNAYEKSSEKKEDRNALKSTET